MIRRRWLLGASLAGCLAPLHAEAQAGRVAAASDLQLVLPELAAAFHRQSPQRVQLSFGSSGNFARQIQQGAPFDLFLSADESFVFRLADAGVARDRGALYAIGRIVLAAPAASTLALDAKLEGLRRDWDRIRQFAIANPAHAPYGRAAREALQALGWWEQVRPRLVLGENISQATQYISTGAAQIGITALSLVRAPAVAAQTRHVVLPASLHQPLRQRMVLLKDARPAAQSFREYLATAEAKAVFARYGFATGDS